MDLGGRISPGLVLALVVGGIGAWYYRRLSRRLVDGDNDGRPDRGGFFRRLQPPDCPEEVWSTVFSTSLQQALLEFRDAAAPTVLFIVVEGAGTDAATQRLRQWVWPDAGVRDYLTGRAPVPYTGGAGQPGRSEIISLRLLPDSADAKLVLGIFKQTAGNCPLAFFLWGKPQVRLFKIPPQLRAADILRVLGDIERTHLADADELGADTVAGLRRQQSEELLGAYSNMQTKQLIDSGRVNLRDFVAETAEEQELRLYGGLSAEEKAMIASAEAAERFERDDERSFQEAEYEEALAADIIRQSAEEEAKRLEDARLAQIAKEEEDAEAAEIWRRFEKEDKLEHLPEEPAPDAVGAWRIVITMAGTGRRLARRWMPEEDSIQHLFDFAIGSATEEEEVSGQLVLVSNFPTRRFEEGALTLVAAGLESNLVLRVIEA